MNLKHLRILNTLRTTKSMVKTAHQHGLKASTISQALSKLEIDLGVMLVDRSTRPIRFTKAGELASYAAENIFMVINNLSNDLADIENVASGDLRIGIIDGLETFILPAVVKAMADKWPHRRIITRTDRTDRLIVDLHDRQVDIAICGNVADYLDGLDSHDFLSEPLVAVVPTRLLQNSETPDMISLPMVQYNTHFPLGESIEAQLKRSRFKPPIAGFVDSTQSLLTLVDAFDGWAVTTPLSVLDNPVFLDRLSVVPTPFPLITRSISIWHRSGELASAVGTVRDAGQLATRHLLAQHSGVLPLDPDHLFPGA